jgi:hypothetical protein
VVEDPGVAGREVAEERAVGVEEDSEEGQEPEAAVPRAAQGEAVEAKGAARRCARACGPRQRLQAWPSM